MAVLDSTDPGWAVRAAAFTALAELVQIQGEVLPWSAIDQGFRVGTQTFRFANQSKGIFRPAGMRDAGLSLKTGPTAPQERQPRVSRRSDWSAASVAALATLALDSSYRRYDHFDVEVTMRHSFAKEADR
jgi:hypothetical protein